MPKKTAEAQIKFTAKDKTKGVFGSVKSQLIGIGAAYLGWQAVTGIIGSIIDKAKENEKAWTAVAASLQRHGMEVDDNVDKIKAFADEMQTLTGISDETIGKGIQGFLDYGQSVDDAFDTMKVAIDFAAGANMQLGSAVELLQKAAVGYTGTLSRYGIIIDENIPKSEKFAAAIDQINERFSGAAQAEADTYAVRIAVMGQKWGDLQEKIGLELLPVLGELTNTLSIAIDTMMALFDTEVSTASEDSIVSLADQVADFNRELKGSIDNIVGFGNIFLGAVKIASQAFQIAFIDPMLGAFALIKSGLDGIIQLIAGDFAAAWETFKAIPEEALQPWVDDIGDIEAGWERIKTGIDAVTESTQAAAESTKAVLENIVANVEANVEAINTIYETGYERRQIFARDQDEVEEEYAVISIDRTGKLLKKTIGLQGKAAKQIGDAWEETGKEISIAGAATADALHGAMSNSVDSIVDSLGFLRTESTGVWKNMAADFTRYFIEAALKGVAIKLIGNIGGVGILGSLSSLFDTSENDRMAARQGADFAKFFTRGMLGGLSGSMLGPQIAMASGPAIGSGMSSVGGGITINFNAPITNREFVENEIVPMIEDAVLQGRSQLSIDTNSITGIAPVR